MSKPSDVAMGLADRFTLNAIRAAHALKQDFCTDAGCVCGGHQLVRDAALTIDAAIQRAVERERGRCCRAVCKHCADGNEPRPARDYDQPMHLFQGYPPRVCAAAAIRATPNTGG